ncbi:sensor histidine kinase [Paenibacillus humicola]|uniref:sensor histidine kinase n=1 Tax=Paenibacillus humicola TaxID=3110540 RepID=UPI00237C297C|nr:sensor histidine kinase [Paenibacillus humicola]
MGQLPVRLVVTIATVFLFVQYGKHTALAWADGIVIAVVLAAYMVFIWLHHEKWSFRQYAALTVLILLGALVLDYRHPDPGTGFANGNYVSSMLWPLIWLLGITPQRLIRSSVAGLAATLAAICFMNRYAPDPVNYLFGPIGLYLGTRGISFFKEGARISKRHLHELHEAHWHLQQAHLELQEVAVHSMRYAALSERTRLARDIHDGIGHQLTSLIIQLQAVEMMLPGRAEEAAEQVPVMLGVARQAMGEIRSAVRDWSADESGLSLSALRGLVSQCAAHSGIHVQFECDEDVFPELPMAAGTALYRILQEALTNAMKHSHAGTVRIGLQKENGAIVMHVTDDGIVSGDTDLQPDFGIKGMIQRCEAAGGRLTWAFNPPHGLAVRAEIPIEGEG